MTGRLERTANEMLGDGLNELWYETEGEGIKWAQHDAQLAREEHREMMRDAKFQTVVDFVEKYTQGFHNPYCYTCNSCALTQEPLYECQGLDIKLDVSLDKKTGYFLVKSEKLSKEDSRPQ